MKNELPAWALRLATPEDHDVARGAHGRGVLQIQWPNLSALRDWAKRHGWPTPWVGFQDAFITRLLESQADFALAVLESGLELRLPKREHRLSPEELSELDGLYAERSSNGRPTGWGTLVAELRKIRRAVEAGVEVNIEGTLPLRTWQGFYAWAHGRYHMLEDGSDHWIGDDKS